MLAASSDAAPAVAAAKTALEWLFATTRDDREIVRGVAAHCVLPVDHVRWPTGVEQDVLTEQVAVEQRARLVGGKVLGCPCARIVHLDRVETVEGGECGQGVVRARRRAGNDVGDAPAGDGVDRRGDLGDDHPRPDRALSSGTQVELDAANEVADQCEAVTVRERADHLGQPSRKCL